MANIKKLKGEDPNAETQATVQTVAAAQPPAPPAAPNPQGGSPSRSAYANRLTPGTIGPEGGEVQGTIGPGEAQTMIGPTGGETLAPSPGYRRPDAASFGEIVNAYNERMQQYMQRGTNRGPARPWAVASRETDLGKLYKQRLDAERIGHEKPPWTVKQVQENEPEFIAGIRDAIYAKYESLPETDKQSIFWQGVKQNPEYAAASMVRRMLFNTQQATRWMTGEEAPKLGDAISNTLELSDNWRWLNWIQGTGARPARGSTVTPPSAAQAGLEEVIRLREKNRRG